MNLNTIANKVYEFNNEISSSFPANKEGIIEGINHLTELLPENAPLLKLENYRHFNFFDSFKELVKVADFQKDNDLLQAVRKVLIATANSDVLVHLPKANPFTLSMFREHLPLATEKTIAYWISHNKISLDEVGLQEGELAKVLPYLTYLKISGSNWSQEKVQKLLEQCSNLETLELEGVTVNKLCLPFKNLQVLHLANCRQLGTVVNIPETLNELHCFYCDSLQWLEGDNSGIKNQIIEACPLLRLS